MTHQWYYSPSTQEIYQLNQEITSYFTDSNGEIKVLNIASKEICNKLPSD